MSKEYWKLAATTITAEGEERFYVCGNCGSMKSEHTEEDAWHWCPICGHEMEYPYESEE